MSDHGSPRRRSGSRGSGGDELLKFLPQANATGVPTPFAKSTPGGVDAAEDDDLAEERDCDSPVEDLFWMAVVKLLVWALLLLGAYYVLETCINEAGPVAGAGAVGGAERTYYMQLVRSCDLPCRSTVEEMLAATRGMGQEQVAPGYAAMGGASGGNSSALCDLQRWASVAAPPLPGSGGGDLHDVALRGPLFRECVSWEGLTETGSAMQAHALRIADLLRAGMNKLTGAGGADATYSALLSEVAAALHQLVLEAWAPVSTGVVDGLCLCYRHAVERRVTS